MTSNELPKASKSASKVSVLLILSAIHHHEDMQNNPSTKPKPTHQAVMAQPLTQALQPQKHPSLKKKSNTKGLGNWKVNSAALEGTNQGVGQVSWTWKGNRACCGALVTFNQK